MAKLKIKETIPMETRISLFQTSMNNAGRNFEGKRTKVKTMGEFALNFYKFAIKEIEGIGELNIEQMSKTLIKAPTKKVVKKSDVKNLMKKIQNKRKKK